MNRIRTAALLITALALAISLSACGGSASGSKSQAQNTPSTKSLDGTWKNNDPDLQFSAIVENDSIEVSIMNGDASALYWKGTFSSKAADRTSITSKGDTVAMQASLMGSQSSTKEFIYASDKITFKFTAMGVTKPVELKKS